MKHGLNGYRNGCRCEACRNAKRECDRAYHRANRERIAARKREYREANRERIAERDREYYAVKRGHLRHRREAVQAATQANASRNGSPWTAAEDAIALDPELTAVHAAFILKRTHSGAMSRRSQLRRSELMAGGGS